MVLVQFTSAGMCSEVWAFSCNRAYPLPDESGHPLCHFPEVGIGVQCNPSVHSESTQFLLLQRPCSLLHCVQVCHIGSIHCHCLLHLGGERSGQLLVGTLAVQLFQLVEAVITLASVNLIH